MIYIYTHQGLGDHIICNGIVRHFVDLYNDVTVFCKPHNEKNVKWMYRDDSRIHVLSVGQDQDTINYIIGNNLQNSTVLVGFDRLWKEFQPPVVESFDEAFYKMINLPFEYRFSKFKLMRDEERENECYNALNPNNEPYIFVHDDVTRGFKIDKSKLPQNIKIIENDIRYTIFDFLKVLENAEEIHMMQSCFKELINSYVLEKPNIYAHHYVREYPEYLNSKGIKKIEIIN